MAEYDLELDLTGLECPLPILRTKKAIAGMEAGQVVHVTATDPGSQKDFPVFAKQTGHTLLESYETDGVFHFMLKKREG